MFESRLTREAVLRVPKGPRCSHFKSPTFRSYIQTDALPVIRACLPASSRCADHSALCGRATSPWGRQAGRSL